MEKILKTEENISVAKFCKEGLVLEQRVKNTDEKILHEKGETYNPDNNIICFTYIDKVSNIIKYTTVARQADNNKDGYQRVINENRVRSIKKFMNINIKNVIPNNIILAIGKELKPKINKEKRELEFFYNSDEESNKEKALIIDGQHRVFGLSQYNENAEVLVTALINIDLLDQAFQFVVINNKSQSAKPVDVKAVINAESFRFEKFSDRLIEAGIRYGSTSTILDYFDRDSDSPFNGLLDWDLNKQGTRIVQIKAIEDIVKNTQKEISYFKENDESEVINYLSLIWNIIKEKYPNAWEKAVNSKHKDSALLKKSTIIAVTNFILTYTKFTKKITKFSYNSLTKEFINDQILHNCIAKVPEEFWFQEWHTGLDTSAGKELIFASLEKIVDNVDEGLEWYKSVEVIKNFN